ncbi:TIGR02285 family protein [Pseudomonas alkylphenolica]|uniref:TIGR02285 family protein n=1 Tax=Pseudomonas alkylphenolica TaxID=237609 RepID=UPI0018D63ADF|nr:TIGR02285 family protein [Pseudomonas alkylphenolica]MBH3429356.1 TIGR02285 family protein [Pseudomonas alkylphenolica]
MIERRRQRVGTLLALLFCAVGASLPGTAWAKERLLWLLRDLPPLTVFEGSGKGQGVVDQLLPMLIEAMPEYDHSIIRVNRARGTQMLQEGRFTCDPTLLWTPERARYVHFAKPSLGVLSSGVVVRKQDQALLTPYVENQALDLRGLLEGTSLKLGVVAERSYSPPVDALLKTLPEQTLSRHYGNDAVTNLLQMQKRERLQLLLGYWPEVRYLVQQQHWATEDYRFYPIQGVTRYQFIHIGCSDTPLGREAVSHINELLMPLRRDVLPALYAHWLDPHMREQYMQESQQFFIAPQ